ncbi:polysaccharide export protein [Arenicella sp.]|nr:polysaccharide export protein [Arenicella sp.]
MTPTQTPDNVPTGSSARLFLLTVLLAVFPGMLTAQSPEPQMALPAIPASDPKVGSHHRVSVDDTLEVRVFQETDLSTRAKVSAQGTILMPLIGKVSVKGKTVGEVATTITAMLRDGYLVNPQVTVNVIGLAMRYFTVLGQVGAPGQFELTSDRPTNLLSAIGRAGGFTRIANKRKVILKRRSASGQVSIAIYNAMDLSRNHKTGSVVIREGDVIEVLESIF